jgi:hypothetical protein
MPDNPNPDGPQVVGQTDRKKRIDLAQLVPNLIYGAIALLLLAAIIWGLSGTKGFLESLGDRTVARGLITFLITFTTIGIAIILAISTLFSSAGTDGEKRFDQGKQVLSVLIGILGTIVGFYFGASADTKAATTGAAQVLTIAPPSISDLQPKKGEKFTISAFVSGGKAPYTYSIQFDPPLIAAIKDVKTTDGIIKQEISVPDTLTTDSEVRYQITVTDSENKSVDYNKDGTQKFLLKTK